MEKRQLLTFREVQERALPSTSRREQSTREKIGETTHLREIPVCTASNELVLIAL